jgi:capsular exopolysaccharide synthesis family protein
VKGRGTDVDLRDYMRLVRKRWRIISLCVLLALVGAAALTALSPKSYSAQAQVFVSAQATADDLTSALQGSSFTQQRVKSYADIVDTPGVTGPVISSLNLSPMTPAQLAKKISASNPLDTLLLNISVTDNDPEKAAKMANAVALQFSNVVRDLETPAATPGSSPQPLVKASVVKPADVPTVPVSPRPKINLALGLLVGLALGIGLAVLRESLDTSIKSVEDLQNVMNTPVLGIIPEDNDARANPLISADQGNLRAEAYRQVRTNLQFIDVERSVKSVVITSAIPDEGKSTTACNLAIAFARTGARVLLVEADLRRPRTADYLGIEGAVGLTNVLLGQVPVGDVLQTWGTLPLKVLPSGPIPPNPSELLGSTPMIELVHLLGSHADIVILDAPPLLPVTDAAVLSTVCDGALIVARHGHTRRDQLAAANEAVTKVGGRVLGVLLNRVPRRGAGKGYGYEYGYGYYTSPQANRPRISENGTQTITASGRRAKR